MLHVPPPNLTTWQVSPQLWALLSEGSRENIEIIRGNPALRREAQDCLGALSELCAPAGERVVAQVLAPLVLVYGLGEQAQAPMFWKVYGDVLGGECRVALERAASEYAKTGKFFPKPAEILELSDVHSRAFRTALGRARAATSTAIAGPEKKVDTPEDRARVEAWMTEIRQKLRGGRQCFQGRSPLM